MTSIGDAILAAREHVRANPGDALGRDPTATATVDRGLRCVVRGPQGQELVSDMVPAVGGEGSAPSPGWVMRAAHAACDATVIAMRAAEEGVVLSSLEVTVDSESDDRGLLGVDEEAPAGPLSTRVRVHVSAAGVSEERLREIIDWALAHSPVGDAMHRAVPVELELSVDAEAPV